MGYWDILNLKNKTEPGASGLWEVTGRRVFQRNRDIGLFVFFDFFGHNALLHTSGRF